MKIITTTMLIIAISIMLLSIRDFLCIKKSIKDALFCSNFQILLFSNLYVGLLIFFLIAYIIYTLYWIGQTDFSMLTYMVMLLLFFGSVFVGVSTLFVRHFIDSVLGVKLNQTDVMTGVMTKSSMELIATQILDEGYGDYVFAIMDLDNFKKINDIYGHVVGDEMIKCVANIIRETVRSEDYVGRFGGDEFLLILKDIQLSQANIIIKRIQASVQKTFENHSYADCTGISVGCATMKGGSHVSYLDIFDIADTNLYKNKNERRKKYNSKKQSVQN